MTKLTLTFKEQIEEIVVYENEKYTVYFDIEDKVVRVGPKSDKYPRIGEMNGMFDIRVPGGESVLAKNCSDETKSKYSYAFDLIEEIKVLKPTIIK